MTKDTNGSSVNAFIGLLALIVVIAFLLYFLNVFGQKKASDTTIPVPSRTDVQQNIKPAPPGNPKPRT